MSYEIGELDRRMANLIRVGSVAALDEANARVKVKLADDITTAWLPWVTARAGNTKTWSAPRVGEQVVVLSPSGETGAGVALPSIYQDAYGAPANSKDRETVVYPDGSTVDYNSATNTLTVTVSGNGNVVVNCKKATVNASDSVKLDSPETTVTGHLTVQNGMSVTGGTDGTMQVTGNVNMTGGTLTHNGKNIGSTHTHTGVQPGGGTSGNPT